MSIPAWHLDPATPHPSRDDCETMRRRFLLFVEREGGWVSVADAVRWLRRRKLTTGQGQSDLRLLVRQGRIVKVYDSGGEISRRGVGYMLPPDQCVAKN